MFYEAYLLYIKPAFGEKSTKIIQYYVCAAEMGIAEAQYRLGMAYELGLHGGGINKHQATYWYEKAAQNSYDPQIKKQRQLHVLHAKIKLEKLRDPKLGTPI